jgi:hypothetical protein
VVYYLKLSILRTSLDYYWADFGDIDVAIEKLDLVGGKLYFSQGDAKPEVAKPVEVPEPAPVVNSWTTDGEEDTE